MPALSSLTKPHPVEIRFEYEDESVTVVFDRNKITQDWAGKIRQGIELQDAGPVARAMAEILISWDVVDDEGNVLPPSVEILSCLPLAALKNMDEQIGEAAVPTRAEGNASATTSSTPNIDSSLEPDKRLNGPAPSPSPERSTSPSPT